MFRLWGSQNQDPQAQAPNASAQSWYPPSVATPLSSSRPSTAASSSSNSYGQRPSERVQTPSHVSPSEAAEIISSLKDKSVEELQKLLSDTETYNRFLASLDQVKTQNHVKGELQKETIQLARENMEKEPQIMELRNQCRITRTTELATAQERLNDLERQRDEILRCYSPVHLLQRLQESMNKTEEESETVNQQLLDKEIELGAFVQKYKKLRTIYHRRALTHLASRSSPMA
uniref:VPS37 C-terminal domain-containing protein n=1 Tax=Fallopia multiflora TaxID=76025 RepID=A0A023W1V3_9CARY|nr:hypothetical protein [Fallopia multiflora]